MADPELMNILRQGSKIWNKWRKKRPSSLTINLSHANLSGANLREANLFEVNLQRAELFNTDLQGADLQGTDLQNAKLNWANLQRTNLIQADLQGANLHQADLQGANLEWANLQKANLAKANWTNARVGFTQFSSIDLSEVIGLETVRHISPSTLGLDTIYYSRQIPEAFLRGAGVPETFITNMPALVASISPIDYYTCFLSYSHHNKNFAKRLHADLQDQGVRCWFAPHDMKTGDKIRPRIDEAIYLQDKLLLILSAYSVVSNWVEHEVETALAKERKEQRTILFPIRLDNAILERDHIGWPALVQHERHIGDFTQWKDHDQYQAAFDRLLRDLKKADK